METNPWDAAKYLDSPEAIVAYIDEVTADENATGEELIDAVVAVVVAAANFIKKEGAPTLNMHRAFLAAVRENFLILMEESND